MLLRKTGFASLQFNFILLVLDLPAHGFSYGVCGFSLSTCIKATNGNTDNRGGDRFPSSLGVLHTGQKNLSPSCKLRVCSPTGSFGSWEQVSPTATPSVPNFHHTATESGQWWGLGFVSGSTPSPLQAMSPYFSLSCPLSAWFWFSLMPTLQGQQFFHSHWDLQQGMGCRNQTPVDRHPSTLLCSGWLWGPTGSV